MLRKRRRRKRNKQMGWNDLHDNLCDRIFTNTFGYLTTGPANGICSNPKKYPLLFLEEFPNKSKM